jgi:CRISPR-associated protein Cas1
VYVLLVKDATHDTELRHPLFRYRASYRRCLEIQARLLAAVLVSDALPTGL